MGKSFALLSSHSYVSRSNKGGFPRNSGRRAGISPCRSYRPRPSVEFRSRNSGNAVPDYPLILFRLLLYWRRDLPKASIGCEPGEISEPLRSTVPDRSWPSSFVFACHNNRNRRASGVEGGPASGGTVDTGSPQPLEKLPERDRAKACRMDDLADERNGGPVWGDAANRSRMSAAGAPSPNKNFGRRNLIFRGARGEGLAAICRRAGTDSRPIGRGEERAGSRAGFLAGETGVPLDPLPGSPFLFRRRIF